MDVFMRKLFVLITAAFFILLTAGCSKKESGTMTIEKGVLKVGVNIAYPPFEYYADDGVTPKGFDIDLAHVLAEKLGLKADIIDVAWEGIFAGVDTDRYDCIISGITLTDERKNNYSFTEPYVGNGQSIILNKNSKVHPKNPQELAGLKVGYLTESTSDVYMTKLAEQGLVFTPLEYDDAMNSFTDLKLGRIDAVVSDSLVAVDYLNKPDNPFSIAWEGPAQEFLGICLKKSNTSLTAALDNALDELSADGTLKRLSEQNFGSDIVSSLFAEK
jgi:polar amino acid transport system substrate-binding protein